MGAAPQNSTTYRCACSGVLRVPTSRRACLQDIASLVVGVDSSDVSGNSRAAGAPVRPNRVLAVVDSADRAAKIAPPERVSVLGAETVGCRAPGNGAFHRYDVSRTVEGVIEVSLEARFGEQNRHMSPLIPMGETTADALMDLD